MRSTLRALRSLGPSLRGVHLLHRDRLLCLLHVALQPLEHLLHRSAVLLRLRRLQRRLQREAREDVAGRSLGDRRLLGQRRLHAQAGAGAGLGRRWGQARGALWRRAAWQVSQELPHLRRRPFCKVAVHGQRRVLGRCQGIMRLRHGGIHRQLPCLPSRLHVHRAREAVAGLRQSCGALLVLPLLILLVLRCHLCQPCQSCLVEGLRARLRAASLLSHLLNPIRHVPVLGPATCVVLVEVVVHRHPRSAGGHCNGTREHRRSLGRHHRAACGYRRHGSCSWRYSCASTGSRGERSRGDGGARSDEGSWPSRPHTSAVCCTSGHGKASKLEEHASAHRPVDEPLHGTLALLNLGRLADDRDAGLLLGWAVLVDKAVRTGEDLDRVDR
mmetsp:Transcript_86215/g.279083  ORF Transcript_86215/g.279083 Transcript_86215/m.279083 type:complete len:386 (-) Transcript_86215:582-1739(-)